MTGPVRGCTGKVSFGTFAKAARAARNIRRRYDGADRVAAYHCQHCNGHHIGEDDTGGKRRPGRERVVFVRQAITLAQFKAMFADEADERPQGERDAQDLRPD